MNDVNIRLQLGIVSDPPVGPVDANTALAPQAWRGAGLGVDLGIFNPKGAAVDLSDLDYLEVDIYPASIFSQLVGTNYRYNPYSTQPYPNLPPAPLQFVTILADDIESDIKLDEWLAGNAQQARAEFSFVQMQALSLGGKQSAPFWLVVSGQKSNGRRVIYGGTKFTVFESGVSDIYLPNAAAPVLVPAQTIFYVAPNAQIPFSETIVVEGQVVVDGGMLVQF